MAHHLQLGGHYIQQSGGTTQIDGSFSSFGGRVTNEGAITVGATGTYGQTRSGAGVGATPATVNTGTFTNAGNTLVNAGTFTNQGSVVNSGTFQVAVNGVATLINHGTVVNSGTFEVGAGVGAVGGVSGTGTYVQNAAAAADDRQRDVCAQYLSAGGRLDRDRDDSGNGPE
jgi:hypothetical protein